MSEETTPSVVKSALPIGLLFGIIMILEFIVSYVMNIDPITTPEIGTIMNTANYFLLPVLFISIACNGYKKSNFGFISFGECLKGGVIVCLIAALVYSLFSVVFNMIFPEFIDEILVKTRAVLIAKSPEMTSDQINMALDYTKKFMNPAILIPITILMYAFLGLIYSLIVGAIIKKDKLQSL